MEADGAVVPGVCDRNGHRNKQRVGRQYWPRKENPKSLSIEEIHFHSDVKEVLGELRSSQWNKFQQNMSQ